jgi:hypothetical protein
MGVGGTLPPLAGEQMRASLFYRIASVLLMRFAAGHTFGFRQSNPAWGTDAVLGLMRSVHFDALGFNRTYWDFFSAFGFIFSVFLVFSGVLAWQLSGLRAETLVRVRPIAWNLVVCFVLVTALSFRFAFTIPVIFSALITICLIVAAWLSAEQIGRGRFESHPSMGKSKVTD